MSPHSTKATLFASKPTKGRDAGVAGGSEDGLAFFVERSGDAVIFTSLYVLGPVAALVVAAVVYVIERGPIIGSNWIDFLDKLDERRARRRQKRR